MDHADTELRIALSFSNESMILQGTTGHRVRHLRLTSLGAIQGGKLTSNISLCRLYRREAVGIFMSAEEAELPAEEVTGNPPL